MKDILILIKNYQNAVSFRAEDMKKQFHTRHLSNGWRSGVIPKGGVGHV